MQHVTVVPQLPYAESSRSCMDFFSAYLQASVQMVMLQQGEGGKQGPAIKCAAHLFKESVRQVLGGNISIVGTPEHRLDTLGWPRRARTFFKSTVSTHTFY